MEKYKLNPQWDNLYIPTRMVIIQKIYTEALSVGEDLEKLKSLYIASEYGLAMYVDLYLMKKFHS